MNAQEQRMVALGTQQAQMFSSMFTKDVLKVSGGTKPEDFIKAINAENGGALTQFELKTTPIESVGQYIPAMPTSSPYISPTTTSTAQVERSHVTGSNITRKDIIALHNENTINEYITNLSRAKFDGNAQELADILKDLMQFEINTLEKAVSQSEFIEMVKKLDALLNKIHERNGLPAFMSSGNNAIYLAMAFNLLNTKRLIYAINWFNLNSNSIMLKFIDSLHKRYDMLRKVLEAARLDEEGNLIVSKEDRKFIVVIAYFFERLRHIEKTTIYETIFNKHAQDVIENALQKVQLN